MTNDFLAGVFVGVLVVFFAICFGKLYTNCKVEHVQPVLHGSNTNGPIDPNSEMKFIIKEPMPKAGDPRGGYGSMGGSTIPAFGKTIWEKCDCANHGAAGLPGKAAVYKSPLTGGIGGGGGQGGNEYLDVPGLQIKE